MNISKGKVCKFCTEPADVSVVVLVTSVGKTPREKANTKATHCCFAHIRSVANVEFENDSEPRVETLRLSEQVLTLQTGSSRAALAVVSATDASRVMNRKRWDAVKKRKATR